MQFAAVDYAAFIGYIAVVVGFAMYISRKEESSEDYFLAGRKLTWWLIGISLIASNISTEHFVGMAGAGYETGLATASYEWTAAAAMVLVAIFLLPRFLSRGIYTIPEFLEYRYSSAARGLMAFFMMVAYVLVIIAAVLYAGAVGLNAIFELEMVYGVWLIGIIAGIYTVWGGLKAVVWADLFNGLGLILGGVAVTLLGLLAVSSDLGSGQGLLEGVNIFFERASEKLSAVRPWNDPEVPWIAVFIGGLWIPQIFYWGLNQFITQRALGAKSVSQGQKGVMFAASLKLIMPIIIIFPGIMAFELYGGLIEDKDKAYPHMIQAILPDGLRGLMFAALFGAVMSSLDSMLNSASTILTMDLYKRHLRPVASDRALITLGRVVTAVFVVIACLWAPQLGWIAGGKGIFDYIQKTWGFITPGIVTVFVFGLCSRRTPAPAATGAMLLGVPVYAFFLWTMPKVAFLHHMAFTFLALSAYMILVTLLVPLRDVGSSAEEAEEKSDGRAELLRGCLIPCGTAVLGAFLLAQPVYRFSRHSMAWAPWWAHYLTAAVAVVAFVLGTVLVLRASAPAHRRLAAPVERSASARFLWGLLRLLKLLAITVVGAGVLALHVYLLASWIAPQHYWQATLDTQLGELIFADFETPRIALHLSTQDVLLGPAVIAAAVAACFMLVMVVVWWRPVPPEVKAPSTTKLDLSPSLGAKIWGLLVLAGVVLMYYLFF